MHCCHYDNYSVENVESQEDDDEKYQDFSGWLIHGIQPSDDDDLQHDSVNSMPEFSQVPSSPHNIVNTT
jgi:hypothetical protein